jgi:hypothetical protein
LSEFSSFLKPIQAPPLLGNIWLPCFTLLDSALMSSKTLSPPEASALYLQNGIAPCQGYVVAIP